MWRPHYITAHTRQRAGKTDNCFSLEYAITNRFNQEEKEDKVGCYSCLKDGKFGFWHDTEFGMLDEEGLTKATY